MSPLQFNQPNIAANVASFIESSGMDPHRLELELTESAIMTDAESNIEKLRALKAMGIALAVDDFGTGYSSLNYLKRFPIDTLKIDQTFVADLDSQDGEAIVDSILALASSLKLQVVAEGVETAEQMDYLMARECDLLQGYYFERPIPADKVPAALEKNYGEQFGKLESMSRRGNCWDNAVAESFFSSLRKERIKRRIYKTRDMAKADIFECIEMFYNQFRRHSHIGGVSPEAFEQTSF